MLTGLYCCSTQVAKNLADGSPGRRTIDGGRVRMYQSKKLAQVYTFPALVIQVSVSIARPRARATTRAGREIHRDAADAGSSAAAGCTRTGSSHRSRSASHVAASF